MGRISCDVRVRGELGADWATWFDGLRLDVNADGTSTLSGELADQAALHGLLAQIRDLGLPLLSISVTSQPATAERSTK